MIRHAKKLGITFLGYAAFWAIIIAIVSGLVLWDKMFPSPAMTPEQERDYYNGVPEDKNNRWGQ